MSKLLVSALLCFIIASSVLCQDISVNNIIAYQKWRFNNKRVYLNDEEQIFRQMVFFDNLKKINDHANNKEATYEIGLNQFSDWTVEEFQQKYLNKKSKHRTDEENRLLASDPMISNKVFPAPPVSVDWRTKGILNPVKDQGGCGSCWTFSTVGGVESFFALTQKKIERFSEQQLLDCVVDYPRGSDGCNGGEQEDGLRYTIQNGVVRGTSYPYVGFQGSCKIRSTTATVFKPKKFQTIRRTSYDLKAALAFSPVIASVNADTWYNYRSGVFNGCESNQLNHAVVAVGYDAQGNWIVRNSYGTSWGESGYIRLAAGNTCGILDDNYVITE